MARLGAQGPHRGPHVEAGTRPHPRRLGHQVILHPPLGPVSGQLVLRDLLQVEHRHLRGRAANAAAGGPLHTQQVLGLGGLVLGLLQGLQGAEAKVSGGGPRPGGAGPRREGRRAGPLTGAVCSDRTW